MSFGDTFTEIFSVSLKQRAKNFSRFSSVIQVFFSAAIRLTGQ